MSKNELINEYNKLLERLDNADKYFKSLPDEMFIDDKIDNTKEMKALKGILDRLNVLHNLIENYNEDNKGCF